MTEAVATKHFIEQRIEKDLAANTYAGKVVTRFPPEPNGYLHIGHAKSIVLNFQMAAQYQGVCHLRFDDTNPAKEEREFIDAIQADIKWLGFAWDAVHHASDYFETLYQHACTLIEQGDAFICDLTADEIRQTRGTLKEPGQESPYRTRSVAENMALFQKMKAGEFAEGTHVLRAKIDMAAANLNMRDPVMYRILHAVHPHTGDAWCIYPMYDFAHCCSDAIELITHSLCTLEFQDHRPLYEWFLERLYPAPRPQQIEFSRLNLTHTLTSKRNLKRLVDEGCVSGWDDPRMPTLVGMRRRGVPAAAVVKFCGSVGISKSDSIFDMGLLEETIRDTLNPITPRVMCVLDPLKLTIRSLAPDHYEEFEVDNHPQAPELGKRKLAFAREVFIEREDFMLQAPNKKFKRLVLNGEVRLRHGYIVKCVEVVRDPQTDDIIELICEHDPNTLGVMPTDRKVKGVIHWVAAPQAQDCRVRLYDRLFADPAPGSAADWDALVGMLNPDSLIECDAKVEAGAEAFGARAVQFERQGYFYPDQAATESGVKVYNRIIALRDSWNKR